MRKLLCRLTMLAVALLALSACAITAPPRTAAPAALHDAAEIPDVPGARLRGDDLTETRRAAVARNIGEVERALGRGAPPGRGRDDRRAGDVGRRPRRRLRGGASERRTAIAPRSLGTLIRHQTAGDLSRIQLAAQAPGADFRLVFAPNRFQPASAAAFDRAHMTALFEAAEQMAKHGNEWPSAPPAVLGRQRLLAELARRRDEG